MPLLELVSVTLSCVVLDAAFTVRMPHGYSVGNGHGAILITNDAVQRSPVPPNYFLCWDHVRHRYVLQIPGGVA